QAPSPVGVLLETRGSFLLLARAAGDGSFPLSPRTASARFVPARARDGGGRGGRLPARTAGATRAPASPAPESRRIVPDSPGRSTRTWHETTSAAPPTAVRRFPGGTARPARRWAAPGPRSSAAVAAPAPGPPSFS